MNNKNHPSLAQSLASTRHDPGFDAWAEELDAYLDTPDGLKELERLDRSMLLDDYADPIITH